MNERLQKWAEEKSKILVEWAEEYETICKEEGIKYNPMVNLAFDRNYVGDIYAFTEESNKEEYLFNSEYKWIGNYEESAEEN